MVHMFSKLKGLYTPDAFILQTADRAGVFFHIKSFISWIKVHFSELLHRKKKATSYHDGCAVPNGTSTSATSTAGKVSPITWASQAL